MAEILDQSNSTGVTGIGFGDTGNGRDYLAQGFIPDLTNVTAVSFYITSVGTQGMKVWIDAADANSNPTGSVGVGIGGATEIPNASLVSGATTKYTLTTPATGLTPGNRYVICMAPWNTTTHAWAEDYRDVRSSTANPYTDGRRVHLDDGFANPTAPDSGNADILFETYGDDAGSASLSPSSSSSASKSPSASLSPSASVSVSLSPSSSVSASYSPTTWTKQAVNSQNWSKQDVSLV